MLRENNGLEAKLHQPCEETSHPAYRRPNGGGRTARTSAAQPFKGGNVVVVGGGKGKVLGGTEHV
jgi:hypothetical protein